MLGVPVVHLDALFWKPGWEGSTDDELRASVSSAIEAATDGWVIDGSYWRVSSAYLDRTDAVVWLHPPYVVCLWRLFWRTVSRAWTRESLYYDGGPRESWRQTFLSRKSVLWWSISRHKSAVANVKQRLAGLPETIRVYELTSTRQVEVFLTKVRDEDVAA